jgi:hemolysin activation/secretion protein
MLEPILMANQNIRCCSRPRRQKGIKLRWHVKPAHYGIGLLLALTTVSRGLGADRVQAAEPLSPRDLKQTPVVPKEPPAPSATPLPPVAPQPTPSPDLNLPVAPAPAPDPIGNPPDTLTVTGFQLTGNTAFSAADLTRVIVTALGLPSAPTPDRPLQLTFAQLLQARSAVTQHYIDGGYITSGAYLPADREFFASGGPIPIAIVEGQLTTINVTGTRHLNPNYIRRRIAVANPPPLNQPRLLDSLRLLRLNPLLSNLNANLAASPTPGQSILNVEVTEAPVWHSTINLNNGRSPSVGSFRRGIQLSNANLLGQGDSLSVNYANTAGSNAIDLAYNLPITPHNTTLNLAYGTSRSDVIEAPFDILGIKSKSHYYELTLRQPLVQTLSQDLAIGLTASRRESETTLNVEDLDPISISPGADDQGRTRISALRFFQEWTQRDRQQVLALRSQFSLGLNALNATINSQAPDSRFFAWRGQAQYVRLLAPDTLLLLRGDLQLADRPLLSSEQFGIGGQDSVRGYRQDVLSTDSGFFASAELRIPILRRPGLLQLTPFIEYGKGWNRGDQPVPEPDHLFSGGLGLLWRLNDQVTARFEWGIPFVSVSSSKNTLQEQGLYFSLLWQLF